MTAQIIPFATMQKMDPALLQEMLKEMAVLQNEQRRQQQQQKQNSWRNIAKPQESAMDPLLGMLLSSMLFGGLFGGFGDMGQNLGALGQLGMLNAAEGSSDATPMDQTTDRMAQMSLMNTVMSGNKSGGGMDMMSVVLMIMILKALTQNGEAQGETGGNGGEMLAPDILRHPKMARFKQNRQSISCSKTLFKRQMNDVFAPRHGTPKLAM
jgi:hypothetical protein